jgi:hypothetical protein
LLGSWKKSKALKHHNPLTLSCSDVPGMEIHTEVHEKKTTKPKTKYKPKPNQPGKRRDGTGSSQSHPPTFPPPPALPHHPYLETIHQAHTNTGPKNPTLPNPNSYHRYTAYEFSELNPKLAIRAMLSERIRPPLTMILYNTGISSYLYGSRDARTRRILRRMTMLGLTGLSFWMGCRPTDEDRGGRGGIESWRILLFGLTCEGAMTR